MNSNEKATKTDNLKDEDDQEGDGDSANGTVNSIINGLNKKIQKKFLNQDFSVSKNEQKNNSIAYLLSDMEYTIDIGGGFLVGKLQDVWYLFNSDGDFLYVNQEYELVVAKAYDLGLSNFLKP